MFTRTTGYFIIPVWMAAMSWVVARDVLPAWTAPPSPPFQPSAWHKGDGARSQYSIHDEFGEMGTVWSEYLIGSDASRRDDLVWIARSSMGLAPMRILVTSVYTAQGDLDEFTVTLHKHGTTMKLHGERFHSAFSFTLEAGTMNPTFKIPLTDGDVMGAAFNPVADFTNLHVGQRWRMQVVNPIACITGMGKRFTPVVVEVTEETVLELEDGLHNCLVVESPNVKAWVDANGATLKQEISLPLLGKTQIVREPTFDEKRWSVARTFVFDEKR
jgi:hypothetical protein